MYLTKLVFNLSNPYVIRNISNCQWIHKILLEQGFMHIQIPNIRKEINLLYHIDGATLMMQSKFEPKFSEDSNLFAQAPQIRNIDKLQNIFIEGRKFHFACTCNPTKSDNGRKVFIYGQDNRNEWLERKMQESGASILELTQSPEKVLYGRKFDKNTDQQITIYARAVTFSGMLEINNAEKFWNAFCNGIGREKSYGCGMIMMMQ